MNTQVTGYATLIFKVYAEAGQFTAICEDLDVASCGDTIDEAFANLIDAVTLYLETLQEHGELEREIAVRKIAVDSSETSAQEVQMRGRPNEYVSAHRIAIGLGG